MNKRVSQRILRVLNVLISSLLGISFGCSRIFPAPAYGMPYGDYKVSGKVVSSDQNQAVKGLAVSIRDTSGYTYVLDSTRTDLQGNFTLVFSGSVWDTTWNLKVEDVDSTENGSFITKDTLVSIPESELKDPDGTWNKGHAEKTVNVKVDRRD